MKTMESLVKRRIFDVAVQRTQESPVVLLEGPRTVGKSTLLRQIAKQIGGTVIDLDNSDVRQSVQRDPSTVVDGDAPILIDEYQRVPEILDEIKTRMNLSSHPGQFVLTGSSRHESLPRAAQALTGRIQRLQVLPFSQQEIDRTAPHLLDRLFSSPDDAISAPPSTTTREEYVDRVVRGGFPLALAARTDRARSAWFDEYVRMTLERDVRELSKIRQARVLPAMLDRLAGQSAQILNSAALAEGLGVNQSTARDYIRLLESVFLVYLLWPWDRTLTRRTKQRPKIHMTDSGVAMRLLRLTSDKLTRHDPLALTEFGHPLETFVVNEILREASWTDSAGSVGQWRQDDNTEVDLVVEGFDGGIVGFEIKASRRMESSDLKGLRRLRDIVGDSFIAGVMLYTGARSYTYEDRLHVMPIDRLWRDT